VTTPKKPKPRAARAATPAHATPPRATPPRATPPRATPPRATRATARGDGARAASRAGTRSGGAPTPPAEGGAPAPSERRDNLVALSAELFAEKGFRSTTVREIADAAGILSGSLYHHFSSKESIADEILTQFLNEVLADYRAALEGGGSPRTVLEKIARTGFDSLERHRAAIMMLQNDWNYFREQSRFDYLQKTLLEVERIWIGELKRGIKDGTFRADLDPKLTYRLFRDTIWVAVRWYRPGGRLTTKQLADQFSRILFEGIGA
jgi:AcrR family transcriptional regulator